MAYNEAEKAVAVEIIRRHGSVTKEAISEIHQALGKKVSRSTIFAWYGDASPENRTVQKNQTAVENIAGLKLDEMFQRIAERYLAAANTDEKINELDGKALVTAAAIATDKMRLLRDLPTEIVQVLPEFMEALKAKGFDPAAYMERTAQKLGHDRHLH